mgnify:CR=1 FL=1
MKTAGSDEFREAVTDFKAAMWEHFPPCIWAKRFCDWLVALPEKWQNAIFWTLSVLFLLLWVLILISMLLK